MSLFTQVATSASTFLLLLLMFCACVLIASKVKSSFACTILIMLTYGAFGLANMLYLWRIEAPLSSATSFFLFASIPTFYAGTVHGKKSAATAPEPATEDTTA